MKRIKVLLFFYKKVVLPAFFFATFFTLFYFGFHGDNTVDFFGILWIIFIPMSHFINYEMRNSETYYFYYNLGWSKLQLWIGTVLLMSILALLLLCL